MTTNLIPLRPRPPCQNCRGSGLSLPRVYGVRWEDEDRGWQTCAVLATSEQGAREAVESVLGRPGVPLQVLQ